MCARNGKAAKARASKPGGTTDMTTARLIVLQIVLLAGLATAMLLPRMGAYDPAGIRLELPSRLGMWESEPVAISDREKEILAKDTEFARRVYRNAFGDEILVSIVLSGHDMVSSIHRPELCLRAQGWQLGPASEDALKDSAGKPLLDVTRMHNFRHAKTEEGTQLTINQLNYYWFVGYGNQTPSHLERSLLDMRDRILRGYNQRWAYITVSSNVTENLQRFGRSEKDTVRMLDEFILQLLPTLQKADGSSFIVPANG